jgi:ATP-binding cassette subfamily C protein
MKLELIDYIPRCRGALVALGLLSGGSNLLALTGSIFMLTVYDRVIPSGSIPSLIALAILALFAYGLQASVDIFRSRILTRIGLTLKEAIGPRIFDIAVRSAIGGEVRPSSALRDVDQLQGFLSSMGPTAMFDLPWLPLYLGICFLFHPFIGIAVTSGAAVLVCLTLLSNALTVGPAQELNNSIGRRAQFFTASQAQAETLHSMGMTYNLSARWNQLSATILDDNRQLSDITSTMSTLSRVSRMILQSIVLALGAYLVIQGNATGGIMIASSILSSRALAPIELTIAHWKGFVEARQSWKRLREMCARSPVEAVSFVPPNPANEIAMENVVLGLTAHRRIVVRDASLRVAAGGSLAIIGPTGSGKSTLARALVGLCPPIAGSIRLDSTSLSAWPAAVRGGFFGYLPQSVALFTGTVAENISRFDPHASDAAIVRAAQAAGVHELISRLPDGYSTVIEDGGTGLSGGQTQRIGLARALYGDPFLVVLDEPNSQLDNDGDVALGKAIEGIKARGGICIVVTHRPGILASIDQVVMLQEGRIQKSGPREDVLEYLSRPKFAA